MALKKNNNNEINRRNKQNEYFKDLAKSTNAQNQEIAKWITSNQELWNSMSNIQREELLNTKDHAKETKKLLKDYETIAKFGSDFSESVKDTISTISTGVSTTSRMNASAQGLNSLTQEYSDLMKVGTKWAKKKAAIIQNTVDRTSEVYGNMLSIGREEFQSINFARDLAKAKAYNNTKDIARLENLQAEQEMMQKVHTQIDETAKLLEQPFTGVDDWIKSIPIFGGLLSSLMPFEDWGKQLSDSFRESAGDVATEKFTGLSAEDRMAKQEKEEKENLQAAEAFDETINSIAHLDETTQEWILNSVDNTEATMDQTKASQENTKAINKSATNTRGNQENVLEGEETNINDVVMNARNVVLNSTVGTDMAGANMMNFDEWNDSIGNVTPLQRTSKHAERGYDEYLSNETNKQEMMPVDVFGLIAGNTDRTALALEGAKASPEFGVIVQNWEELITKVRGLIPVLATAMKKAFGGGKGGEEPSAPDTNGAPDNSKNAEPDEKDNIEKPLNIKEKAMKKMKKASEGVSKMWGKMPIAGKAFAGAIGVAAVGAFKLLQAANELGVSFRSLPAAALIAKEEAQGILDNFGSLEGVTSANLLNMKMMAFWNGVQAEDMAKIAALQVASSDLDLAGALKEQSKWMKEIKKEGLSASKIMADMAANSDFMAENLRGSGDNIRNAAKHMAKMGLSLTEADQVTESLLDWDTRINNEMEASVVLGRSINLDRAARLAYDGKIEEAMKEAKRQAGGEAAFIKMSSTQRKVLGNAIGLQGDALAKFMQTEEQQRLSSKKQEEEAAKARMLQWAKWGALAMGLAVGVIAAISLGGAMGAALAWGAGGFVAGAALGAGLGYITAATGLDETVAKPTMILAGEEGREHVGITPMKGGGPPEVAPPVNVDTSKIESQNNEIITLLSKMPTAVLTEDLAKVQKRATLDSGTQK